MHVNAVPDTECSALEMRIGGEDRLCERGGLPWSVALNPEARCMAQPSLRAETLGRERLMVNLPTAAERYPSQTSASERTCVRTAIAPRLGAPVLDLTSR